MISAHRNLNGSRDVTNDRAHFRDSLSSVGWNLHDQSAYQIEMFMITCNEDMKGNAKNCKNSRFAPPCWGLSGNAQGSSMARW